jgi:hypothetical protein
LEHPSSRGTARNSSLKSAARSTLLIALSCAACSEKTKTEKPVAMPDTPLVMAQNKPGKDTLGPYQLGAHRYIIPLQIQRQGTEAHVYHFTIVDETGHVAYEEEHPKADVESNSLIGYMELSASVQSGPSGGVMLLYEEWLPSAPMSGVTLRILKPVGSNLASLTRYPMSVSGEFRSDSVALNERINVMVWQYNFGVHVPLHIDLACEPGSDSCVTVEPTAKDPKSGLGLFDIETYPRPIEADSAVEMFDRPEGQSMGMVPVLKTSKIQTGRVAAEAAIETPANSTYHDVIVRRIWLQVTIDGVSGWLKDGFSLLGLPEAG